MAVNQWKIASATPSWNTLRVCLIACSIFTGLLLLSFEKRTNLVLRSTGSGLPGRKLSHGFEIKGYVTRMSQFSKKQDSNTLLQNATGFQHHVVKPVVSYPPASNPETTMKLTPQSFVSPEILKPLERASTLRSTSSRTPVRSTEGIMTTWLPVQTTTSLNQTSSTVALTSLANTVTVTKAKQSTPVPLSFTSGARSVTPVSTTTERVSTLTSQAETTLTSPTKATLISHTNDTTTVGITQIASPNVTATASPNVTMTASPNVTTTVSHVTTAVSPERFTRTHTEEVLKPSPGQTLATQAKVNLQRNNSYFRGVKAMDRFHSSNISTMQDKLILIWTIRYYWWHLDNARFSKNIFSHCAYSNCKCTKERAKLSSADMVFIFFDGHHSRFQLPAVNFTKQVTVFQTKESEYWYNTPFLNQDNIFNYSMTYKRNSDVQFGYCQEPYFSSSNFHLPTQPFNRPKTVLWFVSNCGPKGRLRYGRELANFVPVDIHGRCGKKSDGCPNGKGRDECRQKFTRQYRFYLSFENSRCTDYITEKSYKVFRDYLIPIVMGPPKADYEAVLPPGSFIHTGDYSGPKGLADHLQKVMTNRDLFMSYHAWRYTNFRFPSLCTNNMDRCELCRLANEKPKRMLTMSTFWNNRLNCQSNR